MDWCRLPVSCAVSVKAFPTAASARQTASGSGRGSVRCWLLALFGPVAVRVKAVPVVPGSRRLLRGAMMRRRNSSNKVPLDQPVTSAGRHPDSGIFLDDVSVSRRHAETRRDNGECVVVDTASLNGTYVNRKPVESVALANGDEIQMGEFRLVFLDQTTTPLHPPASHQSAETLVGVKPDIVGVQHHHVDHLWHRHGRVRHKAQAGPGGPRSGGTGHGF